MNQLPIDKIYVYVVFFAFLFLVMAVYFKLASKFNIIDKPNARSSHSLITVRGGGIIFPMAAFFHYFWVGSNNGWFLLGLLIISAVSFVDDIRELNGIIRLGFQFLVTALVFLDLQMFDFPFYVYIPVLIFGVAALNAWNFMDGINGITGGYSLLTLITLVYINNQVVPFASNGFMVAVALSLLVFIFYNFRTEARCFAGDIGSVSIALIIIFLILRLILATDNLNYILFILLYGLDSTTTVLFRFLRKENILEAHRSHLYQYLANELGLPHTTVAMIYISIQCIINIGVTAFGLQSNIALALSLIIGLIIFLLVRFKLEGKAKLLGIKNASL